MIAIIDYNIGNVASVMNMLQRLGYACEITASVDAIRRADRIILPGNGAFDACMHNLHASKLVPVLEQQVMQKKIPLLGICVGAQMLGHGSAEGKEQGLCWLDMWVEKIPTIPELRVPHMGWNNVRLAQPEHALGREIAEDARYYFVHSYYMSPKKESDILFHTNYGINFASGVVRGNIAGVQFHPEKSHRFGKQLLNAFAKWKP